MAQETKKPPFCPMHPGAKDGRLARYHPHSLPSAQAEEAFPGNGPDGDCLKLSRASPVRAYWVMSLWGGGSELFLHRAALPHLHLDAALWERHPDRLLLLFMAFGADHAIRCVFVTMIHPDTTPRQELYKQSTGKNRRKTILMVSDYSKGTRQRRKGQGVKPLARVQGRR